MTELEKEQLKKLSTNINATKVLIDSLIGEQHDGGVSPNDFSQDVYDKLVIERYKNVSGHLTHLTDVCRNIFFLFTKLFILGVTAQIAILGFNDTMWVVANSKYLISYLIFIVLFATTLFFSLQIIFCLSQWHMFRNLLANLFDEKLIKDSAKISLPTKINWLFELSYIVIFLIGLTFSGLLVGEAYSKTEKTVRMELISDCKVSTSNDNWCPLTVATKNQIDQLDAQVIIKLEPLKIFGYNAHVHPINLLIILIIALIVILFFSFKFIDKESA